MYCVDKLNVRADISLGDNYTGKDDSPLGSNSVIIRTPIGMSAWNNSLTELDIRPIEIDDIQKAQYLIGRLNNLYFGDLKSAILEHKIDLNCGVPRNQSCREYERAWHNSLRKIECGAQYHVNPQKIKKQKKKDSKKNSVLVNLFIRTFYYLRRKFVR